MYIIKFGKKRYNNKSFPSYEEARKYARRAITQKYGRSADNINEFGFSIAAR